MEATLSLVAGSGWAAGINLYAVLALLGLSGRLGWVDVPEALTNPAVIGVAVALYGIEFFADKIPYVDNAWDAVHTVIRPVGAALLGAALAGDELATLPAALGSGGLAFVTHAAKATTRAAFNTSPEPFSNIAVSLLEDGLVAGMLWFAVNQPAIAIILVILLTLTAAALVVGLWKLALGTARRVRARWTRARA